MNSEYTREAMTVLCAYLRSVFATKFASVQENIFKKLRWNCQTKWPETSLPGEFISVAMGVHFPSLSGFECELGRER